MLGKNHAVLGGCVWLAGVAILGRARPDLLTEIFPAREDIGTAGKAALLGASTIVAAGAAVLPDLDEPEATAARSLGMPGRIASKTVRAAAGGHRQRTHTLLFAGVAAVWGYAAAALSTGEWGNGETYWRVPAALTAAICCLWGFLLIGRAVKDRGLSLLAGKTTAWVASAGMMFFMLSPLFASSSAPVIGDLVTAASPAWWLPAAMGVGVVAHLLGDLPTQSGVPVLWPLSSGRLALKIMKVGGRGEAAVGFVILVGGFVSGVLAIQVF